MERDSDAFPIVYSFECHPSEDGCVLLLAGTGFDGIVVRFAVSLDDIQHFVAFLLNWAGAISANQVAAAPAGKCEGNGCIPIPASSIGIGHPNGSEAYIAGSVGRAELVFSLPTSALTSIGQSLMLAGAPSNGATS
ncbi:MAG TPA: hypothetical protein VGJ20_22685 [Xanthobacteraceae bacterium]